jgi:hypothetical protein
MSRLFERIRHISWSDPERGAKQIHAALRSADLSLCVSQEVTTWETRGLGVRELLCHDTGTHLKWFVAFSPETQTAIWIHQYKGPDEQRTSHARSIHNHRYWFVSAILCGRYAHHHHEVRDGVPIETGCEYYAAPDSYVMAADEVHSVDDVAHPTVTLIVQGPAIRHESTVYREGSSNGRAILDFEARAAVLRTQLS